MLDLVGDALEDSLDHVVLVGDVVVERHGLHPERLTELAHAERFDSAFVDELERRVEDAVPVQRGAGLGLRGHALTSLQCMSSLTPYAYAVHHEGRRNARP